jgi:DNA primase
MTTDILTLLSRDIDLSKVADTDGGEWAGPCPWCGGKDRFRVWPNTIKPHYWCRQCERRGDAIDYLIEKKHLDYKSAKDKVGNVSQIVRDLTPIIERDQWRRKADELVEQASNDLFTACGKKALSYLQKRGLNIDTIMAAKLGYIQADRYDPDTKWGIQDENVIRIDQGISIPIIAEGEIKAVNVRRPGPYEPKYRLLHGSKRWLYNADHFIGKLSAFLTEGEFDCLLGMQILPGVGWAALPAKQKIMPHYQPYFSNLEDVIVIVDKDPVGIDHGKKLSNIPGFHTSEPVPKGKDLTDYYQSGGDVLTWLLSQMDRVDIRKGKK